MPAKDESATFALLATDTGVSGPLTFPGFPGIWNVGETKTAKQLGFDTDEEAREALIRANAPVSEVDASGRRKPVPSSVRQKVEEKLESEDELAEARGEV
jgi:hypothetical protein